MYSAKKNTCAFVFVIVVMLIFIARCNQRTQKTENPLKRIGHYGILYKNVAVQFDSVIPSPSEQQRKEIAEHLDKDGLLYTGKVVIDKDPSILIPPESVARHAGKEYIIAKEPPEVEFAIVPVMPMFLGESPVPSKSDNPNTPGPWSNWSQSAYDSRTGKFYSSVSDHGKYNAHIHLVEYDPQAKKVRCLPEINKVLGRKPTQFSEGKIHGWLDFYQSKDLSSPHLWFCTYWAKYVEPDEEDFASGYDGGHIMSCDVITGDIVDYGVPLVRASWPFHRVDIKRGTLYAVGMFGEFLAWDINEQKTKWAGYLPKGMGWWERAILIDEETGMVYTSNRDTESDPQLHIIKYDPFKNRFFKLACHVPEETRLDDSKGGKGIISNKYRHLRSHTRQRNTDGLFWCSTYNGKLFTFDPVKEEIVDKGYDWIGNERYIPTMDSSPGGRYLYYLPGGHGRAYLEGSPVIQYDTKTETVKVLAFLYPFYFNKYGYTPTGTFSIKLDDKGEKLFVLWNGAYMEHKAHEKEDAFGTCSLTVLTIPESERPE
jgi:hypothetical protein